MNERDLDRVAHMLGAARRAAGFLEGRSRKELDDDEMLALAHLPPRAIADRMRRSWLACRRRLVYLQADGSGAAGALAERFSKRR